MIRNGRSQKAMALALGLTLTLTSCVRSIGYQPNDMDATACISDGGSDRDAAPTLPFGAGQWTFGPPENLPTINSTSTDSTPWLDSDLRTFYFTSRRAGRQRDIYRAFRPSVDEPFGAPEPMVDLNSDFEDAFFPARDGLTAYLTTTRPGGEGESDIWIGVRPMLTTAWTFALFSRLSTINDSLNQWDPYPSHDGTKLYFAQESSDGQNILVSERNAASGAFETPRLVEDIDAEGGEADPCFGPQMKVMVFVAGPSRLSAVGGNDLWYALRKPGGGFSTPQILPSINTTDNDDEPFISPDGRELYFSSNRPGGMGHADIYRVAILEAP